MNRSRPEPDAPVVEVRCFSHFGITVSDLATSIDFYTRVLGFTRLFDDDEEGWTRVGLAVGDIQLELFSPWPGRRSSSGIDPFYPQELGRPKIALTVENLPAVYEQVVAAGVETLCPIVTTPMSQFFFIADPDGTPVQLHEFNGGQATVVQLFR